MDGESDHQPRRRPAVLLHGAGGHADGAQRCAAYRAVFDQHAELPRTLPALGAGAPAAVPRHGRDRAGACADRARRGDHLGASGPPRHAGAVPDTQARVGAYCTPISTAKCPPQNPESTSDPQLRPFFWLTQAERTARK